MLYESRAVKLGAAREEYFYAKRDFEATLDLIEEDIEMLREEITEVGMASLVRNLHTLEDEFETVYGLGCRM